MPHPQVITKFRDGIASGADFADLELDNAEDKVNSVRVTLAQTYRNLSEKRQAQFRALVVLPVDLTFRAAHLFAIWDEEDRAGINQLVMESLLSPVEGKDDHYQQHRILHAYARALLRNVVGC